MSKKYKIDLKTNDDVKRGAEDALFIKTLYEMIQSSERINLAEYEIDEERHAVFESAIELIDEIARGSDCRASCSIGQDGFVGTITIACKHFVPDPVLFKRAVALADSFEIVTYSDGSVEINLTFFKMLTKVRDGSKN